MPVYASTPGFTEQRRYPTALLLIVGGHAALIAAVMTAKMVIPTMIKDPPIVLTPIPIPKDPPPLPDPPKSRTETPQPPLADPYVPPREVPTPIPEGPEIAVVNNPLSSPLTPTVGTNPVPERSVIREIARVGPRWATPEWAVRPPYPDEKRRLDEEATLRLKISIDERGRVIGVEPVGKVDRAFFESARRHLIAHWRYKPATEDGRPVPSSTVVTLRFELEA